MDFFDILLAKKMGGGKATLIEKTITANGTYNAVDDEADGYSSVTVDVVPELRTNNNKVNYSVRNNIVSVDIPDGVTSIAIEAFAGYTKITNINIPESVTTIGQTAFENTSITSIKIPSGVTSLPYRLLNYCTKLTSVNLSEGLTSIGSQVFQNCTQLPSIDIPSTVTSIADAFIMCSCLRNITVRAVNPPTIQSTTFNIVPADANIYVPAESVEAYKAAQYWSARAAHIQAIQE